MLSVGRGVLVLDRWCPRFLAWNIWCLSCVNGYVYICDAVVIQCYLYSALFMLVQRCVIHTMLGFSPSPCIMVHWNMVSCVLFHR
jgi:hypothetical protein